MVRLTFSIVTGHVEGHERSRLLIARDGFFGLNRSGMFRRESKSAKCSELLIQNVRPIGLVTENVVRDRPTFYKFSVKEFVVKRRSAPFKWWVHERKCGKERPR